MGKSKAIKIPWKKIGEIFLTVVVLGIFVGWFVNYLSKNDAEKDEAAKLWITLQEAKEIDDPNNQGPGADLLPILRKVSDAEKKFHPEIWQEHINGVDSDAHYLLKKLKFVVNKNHHEIYEYVSLRQEGKEILAKAKVDKSWPATDLPVELTIAAQKKVNKESDEESASTLTYAMIDGWNLQRNASYRDSNVPALDLSDSEVKTKLAQIASSGSTKEITELAEEKRGVLVPSFAKTSDYENCFKVNVGLVEIDHLSSKCRSFAKRYLEIAQVQASQAKLSGKACKADLIRLKDRDIDIDPCAAPGSFTAGLNCDQSIQSYIRKLIENPKAKEDTHRSYLLEHCNHEIEQLSDPKHRALFERQKTQ